MLQPLKPPTSRVAWKGDCTLLHATPTASGADCHALTEPDQCHLDALSPFTVMPNPQFDMKVLSKQQYRWYVGHFADEEASQQLVNCWGAVGSKYILQDGLCFATPTGSCMHKKKCGSMNMAALSFTSMQTSMTGARCVQPSTRSCAANAARVWSGFQPQGACTCQGGPGDTGVLQGRQHTGQAAEGTGRIIKGCQEVVKGSVSMVCVKSLYPSGSANCLREVPGPGKPSR